MPSPATPRRYLQLDVFADRPGAGNPLAVVLDSDG
ncbi:MAG: PhzF family phenazine biosynthesis protein, partial [Gammaproteobacteria bacterium]|nr:PhzF family phenazine biosynthesis protein [Gammaproteobacteria bacterium]